MPRNIDYADSGEAYGLKWYVVEHPTMGHFCGYVLLPSTHSDFRKTYDDIDADVHGGLTYANEEAGMWCVGFDCAHVGDFMPTFSLDTGPRHEWTLKEVVRERSEER